MEKLQTRIILQTMVNVKLELHRPLVALKYNTAVKRMRLSKLK